MGLYKELEHELVEISKKQKQVYSDAADFGILVSGPTDPICKKIKTLLTDPFFCADSFKQTRVESTTNSSYSLSTTFNIPWEASEFDRNSTVCSQWCISYWKMHSAKQGLVSLERKRVTVLNADIWSNIHDIE
jgi:hypothetical protein